MRENYTLPRLYVDAPLTQDAVLDLPKEQVHYVATVLRKTVGDRLRLFNGQDGEWAVEITALTKRACTLRTTEHLRNAYSCPDIWLCFAPVRKHRNGFILEKGTELGVARFQPVITARTQFPKIRLDKMNTQIIEAAEQTERLDLPDLEAPTSLDKLLDDWPQERALIFADEGGDVPPAMEVLPTIDGPAALLIGPEGGFNGMERERLKSLSFVHPVSLGPRILRADTAALSLLTLWQAVQGDWRE